GSALLAQHAASGGGAAPSAAGPGAHGAGSHGPSSHGPGSHGPTVLAATGPSGVIVGLVAVAAVVLVAGAAFALPALLPHPDVASLSRSDAAAAPTASGSGSKTATPTRQPSAATDPPPPAEPSVPPVPPGRPVTRPPVAVPPVVVPPVTVPPVTVPVDTTAPDVPAVTAPADAVLTDDASPLFSGTGEPGALVRVQRLAADGTTVLEETASTTVVPDGTWAAATVVPVPDGAQSFLITQTDAAGNVSAAARRTMTVDTVALPPSVDAPAAGPLLWLPEITGSAEPGAVVELADQNGAALGTATADGSGAWSIPLPDPRGDGETVTAIQTDRAGNRSAASGPVGPFVFQRPQLLQPVDGGVVPSTGGSTTVRVEIDGVSGMQVEAFVDGVGTGNAHVLDGATDVSYTRGLADGRHTIGVRYVDPRTGRVGSIVSVAFTIG
ncbi:MAG TPA: Ig-like domain-containing protein, partial [Pseudolysinimonas sp.]|nr:Ig-like domain-containing protein [Pseudolysinimonas sp.]